MININIELLAQKCYEAWINSSDDPGAKTPWSKLPQFGKNRWRAVARAVRDSL
jgi:hypothetical protein